MVGVAIVVLADAQEPGDLGRAVNALEAVKEFKEGVMRPTTSPPRASTSIF